MAKFCLTLQAKQKFRDALKKREITPEVLEGFANSELRRAFLAKYVGAENAKEVNALFESKLMLKNQKAGIIAGVKKVLGATPEIKRDILSKIEKLGEVLTPKEESKYYQDAIDKKLKLSPTMEEAKQISDISNKMQEYKKSYDPKKMEWSNEKDKALYGATQVALENYLGELKTGKQTIKNMLGERTQQFKSEFEHNKARALGKLVLDAANSIANTSVSLVASFDNSLFGRQGIITLLSGHPLIWGKAFAKSFVDIGKTIGGQEMGDALKAQLYSDPLYMNGEYQKAGIMSTSEEQYPTSWPEKIPVLGKAFKASEIAFENGSLRMRTELYKLLRDQKIAHGTEMTKEEIVGTGKLVNSVLAKGDVGKIGTSPIVKLMMWAPKMLKADFDTITAHTFSDIPKADRVTARWNLIKIIASTALIASLAKVFGNKDTELDPRSSDFLKIDGKYGYLRGMPQIITLMARLMSGEYKNNKGEIIKYEPGYGKMSRLDAVYSFLRGKAPPATGAVYDALAGQDFQGNEPTFSSILLQKGVPISIQNLISLAQNPSIDKTFGVIGDFFGLTANITPDPNIKSNLIPEGKPQKSQDVIDMLKIYATAISKDPETAFNRFISGQRILRTSNGAIIVQRMSVGDSQAYKKKYGANTKEVKLDHTVPLELGGSNDNSNLKLVSTSEWSSYTAAENALGRALKAGKVSKAEAQRLIKEMKASKGDQFKQKKANILNKFK